MSDALLAAIIAGSVAITVALLTQFAAEAYRRHREGRAVAAALAGELTAYGPAIETMREQFSAWNRTVATGDRAVLFIRSIDRPKDVVYPSMVERLGHLGVDTVEKVVLVYGRIHGFRVGYEVISKDYSTMQDEELIARFNACIDSLDVAHKEGETLVRVLRARAQENFVSASTAFRWVVFALLVLFTNLLTYRFAV